MQLSDRLAIFASQEYGPLLLSLRCTKQSLSQMAINYYQGLKIHVFSAVLTILSLMYTHPSCTRNRHVIATAFSDASETNVLSFLNFRTIPILRVDRCVASSSRYCAWNYSDSYISFQPPFLSSASRSHSPCSPSSARFFLAGESLVREHYSNGTRQQEIDQSQIRWKEILGAAPKCRIGYQAASNIEAQLQTVRLATGTEQQTSNSSGLAV